MKRLLALSLTLAALAVSACFVGCNGASEIAREYVGKDGPDKGFSYAKLTRGNHVRKYGLFVPLSYKPTTKYPVIVFLNGIGEGTGMGEGDGKNMTVGLGPFVAKMRDTFDFIVIFPQSDGPWSADSVYADDVITAIDDVSKKYSVDADRISLTGLSTGGYGTYAIGAKYHDRFAALVPMGSNGAAMDKCDQLTKLAVRAYCSESGDIFAGSNDRDMVRKINSLGGHAEFIATPTSGHDCWEYVYGNGELFTWMKMQRRTGAGPGIPRTSATPAPSPTASARPMTPAEANTNLIINTPY